MRHWVLLVVAACTSPDATQGPGDLVINEVVTTGTPYDWFEVVNAGAAPLDLSEYVFVDRSEDFVRARRFPALTLAPGARHVQEVVREEHGFQLGDAESLWIHRVEDRALVDHVAWPSGAAPAHGSYARIPDVTGRFTTTRQVSRGLPNPVR